MRIKEENPVIRRKRFTRRQRREAASSRDRRNYQSTPGLNCFRATSSSSSSNNNNSNNNSSSSSENIYDGNDERQRYFRDGVRALKWSSKVSYLHIHMSIFYLAEQQILSIIYYKLYIIH